MAMLNANSMSDIPTIRKNVAVYLRYLLKALPKVENEGLAI